MPLSINPVVSSSSYTPPGLQANISQFTGSGNTPPYNPGLAGIDATTNRLGGGIGSGLNGISAGFNGSNSNLSSVVQSSVALGGVTNISTNVGATSNLAGGAQGALGGLVNGAVGAVSSLAKGVTNVAAGGISALKNTATSILGGISGAASDFIGAARSKNVPTGIPSLTTEADVVKVYPTREGDWRVRLSAPLGFGEIVFPVIPNITLATVANYTNVDIVHSNYPFMAYKNSQPQDITISCEWPVETVEDGKEYLDMVLLGRTLTKMFYGEGFDVGQPPVICTLKGFSLGQESVLIPNIPCVVKSFQLELKDDVSYIEVDKDYVPRLSAVSITVTPIYSRTAQRGFNIENYRRGNSLISY